MALARRGNGRVEGSIWPGFVDALTALLLILMFVLSIFMIVQFSLRERITGQDQELRDLTRDLAAISNQLALESTRADDLADALGEAEGALTAERAEIARLGAALEAMSTRFEDAEAARERLAMALTAMRGERDAAAARAEGLAAEAAAAAEEKDALAVALTTARQEKDAETEAARLAAAKRDALAAMVEDLERRNRSLEGEVTAAKAEGARIENQRLAALARLEVLQKQAESARSRAEDGAQARERLAALEGEKARLLDRLSALETRQLETLDRLSSVEAERLAALERAAAAESALSEEEEARLVEAAAARVLRQRLAEQADELDAVTLALDQARREAEETLTLLAAAEAAKAELEETVDEAGRSEALRRVAEAKLSEAEAQTAAERRKVALLNAQVRELRGQLGALQALLDQADARDAEQQVEIESLGQRLNKALAQKVSDLARVRSVFFERMGEVLGGRDDIRIKGDRFVFQSEVLFGPGSATLGPEGQRELAKLGAVLRELSAEMPDDMDWILRVDGHTDRIPVSRGGRYRNNWELSQARALSVVNHLVEREGVPPERLAAAGFGEFQPIAQGDGPDALAANRRIEFKFTER